MPLGELLADAQTGFACGREDEAGIFQFRMNNVTNESALDLSKRRRVPADAHKNLGNFFVAQDDVLFNATNSPENVGKSVLVPELDEKAVFSNHFIRLRTDRHKLLPAYLWRWLQWSFGRGVFSAMCRQWVNQATVSREGLLGLEVPLPPLDEQRRIAAILDRATAVRAKQSQVQNHLAALPEAIFLAMFGDPEDSVAAGSVVRFGEVADLQGGRNLVADDQEAASPYRVLKISAVTSGCFKPAESKALPADYVPPADHLVRHGDLLISRANTTELVGAVAYADEVPDNLVLPDKIWRFMWRNPYSSPVYYRSLFRTASVRRRISQLASGTGGSMKNISKAKLVQLELPQVSIAQQQEFARRVAAIPHPTLSETDALLKSLQSRAFSGQL